MKYNENFRSIYGHGPYGLRKYTGQHDEIGKKALESGADIFEIDVQFDQNQYPILSHNAPPV